MRRVILLAVVASWLAIAPMVIPSAEAVGPGAQLYIPYVGGNETHVAVPLRATGDAPAQTASVLVRLTVESPFGAAPQAVWENTADIEIPPPSEDRRSTTLAYSNFELDGRTGVHRIRAEVFSTDTPTGQPWDRNVALRAFGPRPTSLGTGWGTLAATGVNGLDLDEDGRQDLNLTDPASGQPVSWNVVASIDPWESSTSHGLRLDIEAWSSSNEDDGVAIDLDQRALRNVLRAGDTDLRTTIGRDVANMSSDGRLRFHYDPSPFPEGQTWARLARITFSTVVPQPPMGDIAARGWYDGFQTRVNVTTWDLDGDGFTDLRFWDDTAGSDMEAQGQADDVRRQTPTKLVVHARVNDTVEGRAVTFEVRRHDGLERGAWMEIRSPQAAIRQALWTEWMDDDATLQYELSLAAPDGFVEEKENTTWVWFGHFSTQYLRILLPYSEERVPWGDGDGDGVRNAIDSANVITDEKTADLQPTTDAPTEGGAVVVPMVNPAWMLAICVFLAVVRGRRRLP